MSAPSEHPEPTSLTERAAAAAGDRDRLLDALRAGALLAVVLGHWLVAAPLVGFDGALGGASALSASPLLQGLTWVFQVMPIFFIVGGAAHAAAWQRHRDRGGRRTDWIRRRTLRLVVPTLGVVGVWTVIALAADLAGVDDGDILLVSRVALVPLWFLSTYVLLGATVPWTHAWHRRAPLLAVALMVAGALVIDATGFGGVHRVWQMVNFVFVWGAVHQLGYFWDDGLLWRPHVGRAVALGAFGLLVTLVAVGAYPLSMVGVDGAERTNNSPPTAALILLGLVQLGLVRWGEAALRRALDRPRVWLVVALAGARGMTTYLWHMSAVVIVAISAWGLGVLGWVTGPTEGGVAQVVGPRWWAFRPVWVLCCAVVTAVLVTVFARLERLAETSPVPTGRWATVAAVAGVAGSSGALAGLVLLGPSAPLVRAPVLGFAVPAGLLLVASLVLLGARPRRSHPTGGDEVAVRSRDVG